MNGAKDASDVIIIGNGPAGLSAAIYAARSNMKTVVIGKDGGALKKAGSIENYFGFKEPISGEKLISDGIAQAKRLGVDIKNEQVLNIEYDYDESFNVKTDANEYKASSVIIATGANRTAPRIKGFKDFEGKGINYCAACDAFFYRGKDVAVLGCCEYALHEALELKPIVRSLTLITNGIEPISEIPDTIRIIKTEIEEFKGSDTLEYIKFKDGEELAVDGVFVAVGVAGSSDLAKKIGALTEGMKIVTDENMATNVPGLFAAGDCTGGMMQIAKVVYEGAKAGTEAVKFVRRKKMKQGG